MARGENVLSRGDQPLDVEEGKRMKSGTWFRRPVQFLLFFLLVLPTLTDFAESGHLPGSFRESITEIILTLVMGFIIVLLLRQYRRLEIQSTRDALTGIRNRRQFEEDLPREIDRARRNCGNVGFIFFDLNGFKDVNDRLGHKEGDRVLKGFARALSLVERKGTDACYRLGGDEFALLMTDVRPPTENVMPDRIEERLENEVYQRIPHGVRASHGIVVWDGREDGDALMARADALMYETKKARKAQAR